MAPIRQPIARYGKATHRCKCLIDLEDVNIIFGKTKLAEELRNGDRRTNTHDTGRYAMDGGTWKQLANLDRKNQNLVK